jgi:hypothetical protein
MAKQTKLKTLLEGIFNDKPPINKYEVVEGVRSYGIVGKQLYNNSNIMEIAKQLSSIAEQAHSHVLGETDDWFDQVSVNKNMKALKGNVQEFKKTAVEAHQLNQRLTGLYEDIGHVLNRYYEISDGGEDDTIKEASQYRGHLDNTEDDEIRTRPGVVPNHKLPESKDAGDMDNDGKDEPDDEEYMDNKDKAIKKAMKETYNKIAQKPKKRLKDIGITGIPALGQFVKNLK